MARAGRRDFEGAWHHVMNRGASHQRVYFDQGDAKYFLHLVAEGTTEFGVEVHAFCLMTNHFHLLVHCPNGGLSALMQRVGSLYTKRANWKRGGDGSLFRSRFHSIVIDDEQYLSNVARYIHRNPLDISPPVALDQYRWSSMGAYVGAADVPDWLTTSRILAAHDGPESYARFVENDRIGQPMSQWELEWTISVLVDRVVDDRTDRTKLNRTALLALLDETSGSQHERLRPLVEFPNEAARRQALYRARQRRAASPAINSVVTQLLALTA